MGRYDRSGICTDKQEDVIVLRRMCVVILESGRQGDR
jgi:hypothetical protein